MKAPRALCRCVPGHHVHAAGTADVGGPAPRPPPPLPAVLAVPGQRSVVLAAGPSSRGLRVSSATTAAHDLHAGSFQLHLGADLDDDDARGLLTAPRRAWEVGWALSCCLPMLLERCSTPHVGEGTAPGLRCAAPRRGAPSRGPPSFALLAARLVVRMLHRAGRRRRKGFVLRQQVQQGNWASTDQRMKGPASASLGGGGGGMDCVLLQPHYEPSDAGSEAHATVRSMSHGSVTGDPGETNPPVV